MDERTARILSLGLSKGDIVFVPSDTKIFPMQKLSRYNVMLEKDPDILKRGYYMLANTNSSYAYVFLSKEPVIEEIVCISIDAICYNSMCKEYRQNGMKQVFAKKIDAEQAIYNSELNFHMSCQHYARVTWEDEAGENLPQQDPNYRIDW